MFAELQSARIARRRSCCGSIRRTGASEYEANGCSSGIHAGMLPSRRSTTAASRMARSGSTAGPAMRIRAGRISRRQELHDRCQGTRPARRPGGPREQEHRKSVAPSMGRRQRGEVAGLGGGDELSWTSAAITLRIDWMRRACGPLIHVATHANSLGDLENGAMSAMEPCQSALMATDTSSHRANAREPNHADRCRTSGSCSAQRGGVAAWPAGCANQRGGRSGRARKRGSVRSHSMSRGRNLRHHGLVGIGQVDAGPLHDATHRTDGAREVLFEAEISWQANERELIEIRTPQDGMVFQHFALLPHLTVLDNVAFPPAVQGIARAKTGATGQRGGRTRRPQGPRTTLPAPAVGAQQPARRIARSLSPWSPTPGFPRRTVLRLGSLIRREMQDEFLRLQTCCARHRLHHP